MLIIGIQSKLKLERAMKAAIATAAGLIAFVLFADSYLFLFQRENQSDRIDLLEKKVQHREDHSQFKSLYETIGTGPLSLNVSQFSPFSPNLTRELVIRSCNTRPDAKSEEVGLLLGFKHGKEEQLVLNGQPVYLEFQESNGEPLKFSELKTNLWIKPLLLDKNNILIEVVKEVTSAASEKHEEKTQFILTAAESSSIKPQSEPYLQCLSEAKWWGIDMLMQNYGGEEYQEITNKHKIELSNGSSNYLCYVGQGDFMTWEEGVWRASALKDISQSSPIAWVKSIGSKELELQIWDESGFYPAHVKIEAQQVPKMAGRSDLPSSIRLRTASQITCLLGKRRMVLRKGDWLMKTSTGWRILKRIDEIEDCLQHRLKGDLLIFDGIEKAVGQTLMKGHVFDEMRTQVQPVSIAILAEKKSARRSKLQNLPMHKRKMMPSHKHPGRISGGAVAAQESKDGGV